MIRITLKRAAPLLVPLLFGCASYAAPNDHLANAVANIRAAQEAGAAQVPQAALHLKLAQEEQAKARSLIEDGRNEQADFMTMRSNADAELAIALTHETSAEASATAAQAKATSSGHESAVGEHRPASATATTTTTSTTVPASAPPQ